MKDTMATPPLVTSFIATATSFGVTDVAQLVAISVGVISGLMAIRHYATATQLNKMKIAHLSRKCGCENRA